MAKKKVKKVEVKKESVELAGDIVVGKDGQKYQRPDPVVSKENAVAQDAPVYS